MWSNGRSSVVTCSVKGSCGSPRKQKGDESKPIFLFGLSLTVSNMLNEKGGNAMACILLFSIIHLEQHSEATVKRRGCSAA